MGTGHGRSVSLRRSRATGRSGRTPPSPALDGRRAAFVCVANPLPTFTAACASTPSIPAISSSRTARATSSWATNVTGCGRSTRRTRNLKIVNRFLDKLAASGFNYVILNAYAHDTSWRKGKTGDDDYGPPPMFCVGGDQREARPQPVQPGLLAALRPDHRRALPARHDRPRHDQGLQQDGQLAGQGQCRGRPVLPLADRPLRGLPERPLGLFQGSEQREGPGLQARPDPVPARERSVPPADHDPRRYADVRSRRLQRRARLPLRPAALEVARNAARAPSSTPGRW